MKTFQWYFSPKASMASCKPLLALTPPAMATVLMPVCLLAFTNLFIRMSMMVFCTEAQRSALFSSMKFGLTFRLSRTVYKMLVFSPLKL